MRFDRAWPTARSSAAARRPACRTAQLIAGTQRRLAGHQLARPHLRLRPTTRRSSNRTPASASSACSASRRPTAAASMAASPACGKASKRPWPNSTPSSASPATPAAQLASSTDRPQNVTSGFAGFPHVLDLRQGGLQRRDLASGRRKARSSSSAARPTTTAAISRGTVPGPQQHLDADPAKSKPAIRCSAAAARRSTACRSSWPASAPTSS